MQLDVVLCIPAVSMLPDVLFPLGMSGLPTNLQYLTDMKTRSIDYIIMTL